MSEPLEKKLISAFADSWNELAGEVLGGQPTELSLLALREVSGDKMAGALAVAMTWSAGFAAPAAGGLPGVCIALFKSDEVGDLERLAKQPADGSLKPGARALVNSILGGAAAKLNAEAPSPVTFGEVTYIDFSADESRLANIAGDAAWVGTFALTLGDDVATQALMLYAPHGSLQSAQAVKPAVAVPTAPPSTPMSNSSQTAQPQPTASRHGMKREEAPKNIERLLEVEMDVVVRFGMTHVPLRDAVRMGVGTIIELNRGVDEPVELLVNGRLLARGEVVVIDGYYGVRVTEIGTPAERPLSLI